MSNGYLVAAPADAEAAREIGDGFGLDVIETDTIGDPETVAAALANAANVGLLLSNAAANDVRFVSFMHTLATRLQRAQVIAVEADTREHFGYLPSAWPEMSLEEARNRAAALVRQRQPQDPAPATPAPVEQEAPAEEQPPVASQEVEPAPQETPTAPQ